MRFRRRKGSAPNLPSRWSGWNTVPEDRLELAREIESCEDFGVDEQAPGVHQVALYDDLRGLVGDDAIEALPEKIAALDGVERCDHLDREVIEVEGTITADHIAAFVVAELAVTGDPHYWDDRST